MGFSPVETGVVTRNPSSPKDANLRGLAFLIGDDVRPETSGKRPSPSGISNSAIIQVEIIDFNSEIKNIDVLFTLLTTPGPQFRTRGIAHQQFSRWAQARCDHGPGDASH